jgi:hypothetical protein
MLSLWWVLFAVRVHRLVVVADSEAAAWWFRVSGLGASAARVERRLRELVALDGQGANLNDQVVGLNASGGKLLCNKLILVLILVGSLGLQTQPIRGQSWQPDRNWLAIALVGRVPCRRHGMFAGPAALPSWGCRAV